MRELLQDDDPDPLPERYTYPVNLQTDLAFDDVELVRDLAERERIGFEKQAVAKLSNYTSRVLNEYGEGVLSNRQIRRDEVELYRRITDGAWSFAFIDTIEGRRRCRAWALGGDSVSWCEDEQRYEPADEVLARLSGAFPMEVPEREDREYRNQSSRTNRLRRLMAAFSFR